jgi:hypothetical protein
VSQQTSNHSFDDLARALAEGSISRRGALKLFAGTAIAALIPSRALAQQRKVTICHKPGTPDEETKEVPDSAVGSHLRHGDQLGPCCQPNGSNCSGDPDCCSGNCVNSTCSACPRGPLEHNYGICMSNDQCCSGNCSNGFCCASGRVALSNGTCVIVSTATVCTCPAGGCDCVAERDPAGSRQICASNETAQRCFGSHRFCGEGSFCGGSATDPRCQLATGC